MKNLNLKEEIKRVNPDTLVNRGYAQSADVSGIVCPHCGNGSGEDGTGIEFKQDANGFYRAHCFKCGENFDNLRLIADHFGYNLRQDFPKVLAEGATLLGASASFDFKHHHKSSAKNFNAKQNYQQNNKAQETRKTILSICLSLLIVALGQKRWCISVGALALAGITPILPKCRRRTGLLFQRQIIITWLGRLMILFLNATGKFTLERRKFSTLLT